jgi:hypothetical protein
LLTLLRYLDILELKDVGDWTYLVCFYSFHPEKMLLKYFHCFSGVKRKGFNKYVHAIKVEKKYIFVN